MKRIAFLILLSLSGTACARGSIPVRVISSIPEALRDKGTARVEMTINLSGREAGIALNLELKTDGAFDFKNQRGQMIMRQEGDEYQQVLFQAGKVYVPAPPCLSQKLGEKSFVSFSLPGMVGSDLLSSSDPTRFLQSLRGVSPEIQ